MGAFVRFLGGVALIVSGERKCTSDDVKSTSVTLVFVHFVVIQVIERVESHHLLPCGLHVGLWESVVIISAS